MSHDTDDHDTDSRVVPLSRRDGGRRRCPICQAPALHRFRPFCSQRCADVDLGRWVKGGYRIETEEAPEGEVPPGHRDDED